MPTRRHIRELDYIALGPAVTAAATRRLWEHGVREMGIDAWAGTARCTFKRRRPSSATSRNLLGRPPGRLPYAQIERLVNLDELPSTGFEVACFPLRTAGAGPARVVALLTR